MESLFSEVETCENCGQDNMNSVQQVALVTVTGLVTLAVSKLVRVGFVALVNAKSNQNIDPTQIES